MTPNDRARRGGRPDPATLKKTTVATNRKARHDFAISHVVEAGLVLYGSEVKSLRVGSASLQDAFARVEDGEVWLYGVHVPPLPQASYRDHLPTRRRKCLLHGKEIRRLEALLEGAHGTTIVALSLYIKGSRAKVELGVGRGKKFFDKREDIKKRTAERDVRRAMRRG